MKKIIFHLIYLLFFSLAGKGQTDTLIKSGNFKHRGESWKWKIRIPGPIFSLRYDQNFSVGIGFHYDIIKMRPGERMGHWRYHNFLLNYTGHYYFSEKLHLSEEVGLNYFNAYSGIGAGKWRFVTGIIFSHHTDFNENTFITSPSAGITKLGMIECKVGYKFILSEKNAFDLKNYFSVEVCYRPLMRKHPHTH